MKRILMLGGSQYQICAIKKAKKMGYYVITCDYLPDNPGHKYSDEYYNVSTTDKNSVLLLADKLCVDAVVCYASDPAAPTAAYVSEKLGLPTSPFESVVILSDKELFREFLYDNGFNTPKAKGYSTYIKAAEEINEFTFPVIIKPVDSSGSKGVNKLENNTDLEKYIQEALNYSRTKRFIIEEFIDKEGFQVSGDGFSVNGELKFTSFANEYYSNSGIKNYVPLGECWPSILPNNILLDINNELQKLISLLHMKTNAYNIEVILDKTNKIYILELGARNGGSFIPQIIEYATGVDLVEYTIKAALGEDCSDLTFRETIGYWANYMLHSKEGGRFKEIWMLEKFKQNNLIEIYTDFNAGDQVNSFNNAGDAIGTAILRFSSKDEMFDIINNMDNYIKVLID